MRRRVRAAWWAALAVILPSFACSGGSGGSAPFEIVSPASRQVVVTPGQSVRFEIRANGGRTVEYVIDQVRTEPGPVFVLQPSAQHHVVEALIVPPGPAAPPDVVLFTVDVESPGNLAPQITSFTVEPVTGEAQDTEFTARVTATDADGTVDSVSVDFGDGTPPARGVTSPFTAIHTYAGEGTFIVTARAVDDAGVPATSTRQLTVAPHNDPPTGTLHAELTNGTSPEGVGPLTVRLETQGVDGDGAIATWEIDKDLGQGFELIAAGETVTVEYPFQEDPYTPLLRLTDNQGEAAEIVVDHEIVVLRDVSASNSELIVKGNPLFEKTPVAPVIWADGQDPMAFTIHIRDSDGLPVSDVRVRARSTRPPRVAPNGFQLPPSVIIQPGTDLMADASGTVTGWILTDMSTRVEPVPIINLQSFGLEFEVDLGRNFWVPFELDPVELNAQSTVSDADGRVVTMPQSVCPGEALEVRVEAENDRDAPGGNTPARGKYTELRNSQGELLPGHHPIAGFQNWRTNQDGEIVFTYNPVRADQNQLFIAWVDGRPLRDLGGIFLKPPAQCGGQ